MRRLESANFNFIPCPNKFYYENNFTRVNETVNWFISS